MITKTIDLAAGILFSDSRFNLMCVEFRQIGDRSINAQLGRVANKNPLPATFLGQKEDNCHPRKEVNCFHINRFDRNRRCPAKYRRSRATAMNWQLSVPSRPAKQNILVDCTKFSAHSQLSGIDLHELIRQGL